MKEFNAKIQKQLDSMIASGILFRSTLTGDKVWDIYLKSFGDDPVFRDPESSEHNCNYCKNFIRRYGNIVSITDGNKINTLFDFDIDGEYQQAAKDLSKALQKASIGSVFVETLNDLKKSMYDDCKKTQQTFQLGVPKNVKRYTKEEAEKYGVVKAGSLRTFDHISMTIPKSLVSTGADSVEKMTAFHRDNKNVFERAMVEIPLVTLQLVRDLIIQGSLLDGSAHVHKLEAMIPLKEEYDKLSAAKKKSWLWKASHKFQFAKFKNELIGTLCTDLAEGVEINKACQTWNKRVDPANYMKAVAPFTEKQKKEAEKFVMENGYAESFRRRLATLADISADEIKHINGGDGKIKEVSIFDNLKATKSHQHKRSQFDGIEEVPVEKFLKDILPTCTSVEAFLENRLSDNMVTMTTSEGEGKPLFKWDNNYSWTYNGNLAGKSQIKQAVKAKGGSVTGVLRFSIMWAENDGDNSDLDAHCIEPDGHTIYYGDKRSCKTGGTLDIDIVNPKSQMPQGAVENITYPILNRMTDGKYQFIVNQFNGRSSKGFKAEIEFDGQQFYYEYNQPVRGKKTVATVTLKNGVFSIDHSLPETNSTKEIYGKKSQEFHKVSLACLSPNHWNGQTNGNKHYFFMLDGCKAEHSVRGYHVENLNSDLTAHRKVLEPLASSVMIPADGDQLSGLGFNATVPDELIVKLSGSHQRTIKIKF